jgi:DNA-binding FrmR family transcriptional regulator
MDGAAKGDVVQRLKSVHGHLGGLVRMAEEDAYCVDLLRQIQAVQAALDKVSARVLENHLGSCVVTAVRGEDPAERERVLSEIVEVFKMEPQRRRGRGED